MCVRTCGYVRACIYKAIVEYDSLCYADKSVAQVSLRWLLQRPNVPSVIVGAKTVKQLEDNLGAGRGWKLTEEEVCIII